MKAFFILLLIIIIGVGGYVGSILVVKDLRSSRAESMTKKYVGNMYSEYSIIGINCQGEDTDGDSYVSCDVRLRKGSDDATDMTRYLSCPTMWKSYTGSTCKERQILPTGN